MRMMNNMQEQGAVPHRYRLNPAALLLPLVLLVAATPTFAQYGRELQYLIFDPVPLNTPESPPATGTTATAQTSQAPTRLSDWLRANTNVSVNEAVSLSGDISGYERAIADLETAEGPFSAALPQQLLALGDAHQANGDLELAQQYFEQASHVTRINHGLFSTEQVPAIERIIENRLPPKRLGRPPMSATGPSRPCCTN
ncbi:MAG TPA: tetratricopeptide repeat protein, partial [Pseudomonadaceae bacterium]|nr:tetratricopeptide repeat protein [Pseudomonadaceae bacterium]